MVSKRRRSKLSASIQQDLIRHFVTDATACSAVELCGVNRNTATLCFHKQRELIGERLLAEGRNHINGIENFWNQAKRHLRRYNGIPRQHFYLYLKECEWRFNYRPAGNLLKLLRQWANI